MKEAAENGFSATSGRKRRVKDTRAADLGVGIGFIALGGIVIHLASQLQKMPRGIGPGGYPRVVAYMMILLGLIQAARVLAKGMPKFGFSVDRRQFALVAAAIAASFIYVYLVRYLGFLLLTPFLLFLVIMLFGYRKYLKAAVISVCVSTALYIVFAKIFMIFLPTFNLP